MITKTNLTLDEFWTLPEGETVTRVWVVNPESVSITVFSPDGTRFPKGQAVSASLYTGNTKIIDSLLPGLELSTQLIFEEAELI